MVLDGFLCVLDGFFVVLGVFWMFLDGFGWFWVVFDDWRTVLDGSWMCFDVFSVGSGKFLDGFWCFLWDKFVWYPDRF